MKPPQKIKFLSNDEEVKYIKPFTDRNNKVVEGLYWYQYVHPETKFGKKSGTTVPLEIEYILRLHSCKLVEISY